MPAIPSLSYYQKAIQAAGLPTGDVKQMRKAQPLSKFAISDAVRGGDTATGDLQNERVQKVQRLADMDKRLNGIYSDPNNPLYSTNPFNREASLNSVTNVAARDVGATDQALAQNEKGIESNINDIAKFYSDLITQTAREKTGGGGELDFDKIINDELGISGGELSDEDLMSILQEAGLTG